MPVSRKDEKLLWGKAAARCSLCKREVARTVSEQASARPTGEHAHIFASREGGPRGSGSLPQQERDAYGNLILLCPSCHTEVDKHHEHYSPEELQRIKLTHEAWVEQRLSSEDISVVETEPPPIVFRSTGIKRDCYKIFEDL